MDKSDLSDDYPAVLATMKSTCRELDKDQSWRDQYEEQLHDLTSNKFSREVSKTELEDWIKSGGKTYWISHQMVIDPGNKSTPMRCVFNSSQRFKGYSLNACWDLGSDMTGNLHGILMRFRQGNVTAQGDIRKMYYGVRVTKEEEFMQLYMLT